MAEFLTFQRLPVSSFSVPGPVISLSLMMVRVSFRCKHGKICTGGVFLPDTENRVLISSKGITIAPFSTVIFGKGMERIEVPVKSWNTQFIAHSILILEPSYTPTLVGLGNVPVAEPTPETKLWFIDHVTGTITPIRLYHGLWEHNVGKTKVSAKLLNGSGGMICDEEGIPVALSVFARAEDLFVQGISLRPLFEPKPVPAPRWSTGTSPVSRDSPISTD